jgi:hypothetical protein
VRAGARKALRALAGFVGGMKVPYRDIEVALDADPEKGLADSGDLNTDLSEFMLAAGQRAIRAINASTSGEDGRTVASYP